MSLSTTDAISKTSVKLLLSEPFYGHFMMGLPKEVTMEVPTAAVAFMNKQSIKLMVNPDFWESLTEPHRYGIIKHEVLHIVLKHLFAFKNYSNKVLFNIAADIVVNQYIERLQLPEGCLLLEKFAYLEPMYGIILEPNMDVGYYYKKLDKSLKTQAKKSFNSAVEATDEKRSKGEEQTELSDLLKNLSEALERHNHWKEVENLNEGEFKIAEQQANRIIKQTANRVKHKYKNYGNLPAGLAELLEQVLADMKPVFNWRRLLRLFATNSNSSYIKNTIRRPSKRYGTVPGVKVKRRNKLLLAIDTSGSVSNADLVSFFSEIYFIWKNGAEILIVECDTHIHKTYPYIGQTPDVVHGRGGTAFDAPILFANETFKPDALLYFTDGFAPAPVHLARYPILWVITTNGLSEDDDTWDTLPGKKLKMN